MRVRNFIKRVPLLLCVGLFFCSINSWAQVNSDNFQKMVDILPPAPNASAIIKHSAITVSNNTGSPGINIPLFAVQGTKLTASLSLGYSSSGIKVDEIASRVGMGWTLQAGGVITRTIRGWADEFTTRVIPPTIGANCGTYNFCYSVVNSNNYGGSDSEPDLYNFSMQGISGSFVYDAANTAILIPAQKIRIEKNLGSGPWNFRVTTTDGIKYYFGGPGATEKTKRLTSCGRDYSTPLPTAWYLTKIEHPSGETIIFTYTPLEYTYETGVSETMNWADWMVHASPPAGGNGMFNCPSCPPANPTSRCINFVKTQGVLLSSVLANDNVVNITYTTRLDCADNLVANIKQYDAGVYTRQFVFNYNQQLANLSYQNETAAGTTYTPYLTSLQQLSADNLLSATHHFIYDDPAGRPPRLSFSQDHWGYFNGKINTCFIPKPDISLPVEIAHFPNANANRDPDTAFAGKGMLVKIVYPTGGLDNIQYESNELLKEVPLEYQNQHGYACTIIGTGTGSSSVVVSRSYTFTIDRPQILELTSSCVYTNSGTFSEHFNYSDIEVKNSSGAFLYNKRLLTGTSETVQLNPTGNISPGTYTLTYKARGAAILTDVVLKYKPLTFNSTAKNTIVGGVRVKRVFTGNPSEKPTIKRYYYSNPETLDESSLHSVRRPIYNKDYKNTLACTYQPAGNFPSGTIPGYCWLTSMYSNSLNNIFDYQSSPVSYYSVIESEGENFEGGGRQSRYYVSADIPGTAVIGELMLGATLSNSSQFGNGKVYEDITIKKMGTHGPLTPIKKTRYNYIVDNRAGNDIFGYAVNQKYQNLGWLPTPGCPPSTLIADEIIEAYDITQYHISAPWMHLESQTDSVFDENGLNPVSNTRNYFFDNTQHLQLTRTETTNSKNQLVKETLTYPQEHEGTAVYDDMIIRNMLSPVVSTTTVISGSPEIPVAKTQIDYGATMSGSNDFAPVAVKKSVKGNALETEGTINLYDNLSNILQFTGKDEVITAVIRGYNYKYPIAKVVGATYAQAIAQLSVSLSTLQTMDGSSLITELNRIRTGLPAALVTSYTYKPGTGVISITDPTNKTNTYNYDPFNRLLTIKDQDGNTVKKMEYVIANPDPNAGITVYYNQLLERNYTCTTCSPGFAAMPITYTVPAGKYYSLLSVGDANVKAAADTALYGQEFVNMRSICSNINCTVTGNCDTINCTGVDKKCVYGTCETGWRVNESTFKNKFTNEWTCVYHYEWSDASISQSYSEVNSSPCMILEN